eukprot:128078_1
MAEANHEEKSNQVFTASNMSKAINDAKYAVRGLIVARAKDIKAEIESNADHKHPFTKVVFCNIGNPQAFVPPPITFHRQVLACVLYPPLMDDKQFPKDVIARAKRLLNSTAHQNIGAYTTSIGLSTVRQSVAGYLEKRDGFPASADKIFLTNGASAGITYALQCLISSPTDGILLPIPQYPLYSATVTLNRGVLVPYELDEAKGWSADLDSIEKAIIGGREDGTTVKGIVVINPGNPTGQCMSQECVVGILALAYKYNVVIIADEVYQENIYDKEQYPFVSFRKTLLSSNEMKDSVELISVHSVSKGIFSECGLRGGYMEFVNIAESGIAMVAKLASIGLCPNTIGQCVVDMVINPPKDGDESYPIFEKEYEKQYESLRERAQIISTALTEIDGISCNAVYGAMYAFPNITLPDDVVANVANAYKEDDVLKDKAADFIYCMELLENHGVCVIPGSGFGQKNGTFHFRTTLLPPKEEIQTVVDSIAKFHKTFIEKYSQDSSADVLFIN